MLDEELLRYRKQLEEAINNVLSESSEIRSTIKHIRDHGYEAFLIVEATIGFNKRDDADYAAPPPSKAAVLNLTTADEDFLRSLKIKPE